MCELLSMRFNMNRWISKIQCEKYLEKNNIKYIDYNQDNKYYFFKISNNYELYETNYVIRDTFAKGLHLFVYINEDEGTQQYIKAINGN